MYRCTGCGHMTPPSQSHVCKTKEAAIQKVAYVSHCPGHKNSKGESAEWCVKSHETGKIISSHGTEAAAKKHLQDMHAHSGSEKSAEQQYPEWCDHCISKWHPEVMMGHASGHGQVGKCSKCGRSAELRTVKVACLPPAAHETPFTNVGGHRSRRGAA